MAFLEYWRKNTRKMGQIKDQESKQTKSVGVWRMMELARNSRPATDRTSRAEWPRVNKSQTLVITLRSDGVVSCQCLGR